MSTSSDVSGVKKEDNPLSTISADASNDSSDDISEEDSFPSYSLLKVHRKPDSDMVDAPAEDSHDLKRQLEEAQTEIKHLNERLNSLDGIQSDDVVNLRAENKALVSSKALLQIQLDGMLREREELMLTLQESRNLIKLYLEPGVDEKKIIAALHSDRVRYKKEKVRLEAKVAEYKEQLEKLKEDRKHSRVEEIPTRKLLEPQCSDKEQRKEESLHSRDEEIPTLKRLKPRCSDKKQLSAISSKDFDSSISIVKEEKSALERENWKITQENLDLKEEKAALQTEYEKIRKMYNNLLAQLRDKDNSYQSDLEVRVKEIEKLAMEIQRLLT